MSGLMDRLGAAKAAQEAAASKKAAEAAAEKTRLEQEARKGELSAQREKVAAELAAAEQSAAEADAALAEVAAMEAQGELDADVKKELDTIKEDAAAAKAKFEELQTRMAALDQETGEASPESAEVKLSLEEQADEQINDELQEVNAEAQALEAELDAIGKESSDVKYSAENRSIHLQLRPVMDALQQGLMKAEGKREALVTYIDGQLGAYKVIQGDVNAPFDLEKMNRDPMMRDLVGYAKTWNELNAKLKSERDVDEKMNRAYAKRPGLWKKAEILRALSKASSEEKKKYIASKSSE